MNAIREGAAGTLGHIAVFALLVLPCAAGSYAAYAAIVAIGLALVVGFDWPSLVAASRLTWVRMLAAAFVLLAVAFTIGAKTPRDASYTLDFLPLLMAVPTVSMLNRVEVANGAIYLARLALLGSIVAVVVGVYDLSVLGIERAKGLENSPIHYAAYAQILGFMALTGVVVDRSIWRWLYFAGPVMGFGAVLLSGTRAALVVGVMLALIFCVVFWRTWIRQWTQIAAALGIGFCAVVGSLAISHTTGLTRPFGAFSMVFDVITGKPIADFSTSSRLDFYHSGFRAFLDAPWFGHGWQNQIKSAAPYFSQATQEAYVRKGWGFIHNEPLGFAISGGVLGLVAYCLLMLSPVVAYFSLGREQRSPVQLSMTLTLVAGFVAAGMTDVLFMWELPKMMFVVIGAAIAVLLQPRIQGLEGAVIKIN